MGTYPEMSDSEKLNSIIMGIEYYDGYLDTKIKKQINGLDSIYTKLLKDETKNVSTIILEIKDKFNDSDLFLLNYLLPYTDDTDEVLITKPKIHSIKENIHSIITIVYPIIAITVFILQIMGFISPP